MNMNNKTTMVDTLDWKYNDMKVMSILLKDRTTGNNIIWGTKSYDCGDQESITIEQATDDTLILPRVLKRHEEQKNRTKQKAEVFTPVEIVKKMNDQVTPNKMNPIEYIGLRVLEVTCGEAPFLVNRYDSTTGSYMPLVERVGLLDRKMQWVNYLVWSAAKGDKQILKVKVTEQTLKELWFRLAELAVKNVYAYEWQGDSLFIARMNILLTMNDYYEAIWGEHCPTDKLLEYADIISCNIMQMDGVSMCVPMTDIPAKIKNWETGSFERFDGKE